MEKTANFVGKPLLWRSAALLRAEYELRSDDLVVAVLRFRSAWGTFATAESGDGCWTFKRVGFWQTRATIRACDSEEEIATFKNNTWTAGGTLVFPDGRQYPANTNFWQTQYEFTTEAGEPLIHFRNRGLFGNSAEVTILPAAKEVTELPWMVCLGWYLIVMMQNDTAAAAS
ncbi:MAG: hypothetical protein ACM3VT_04005 [Solirubrobacterales bacterium]